MGAMRAMVTIRHVDGTTSYINDARLAEQYIKGRSQRADGQCPFSDIDKRTGVSEAAFSAHAMLSGLNGRTSLFFGDAVRHARGMSRLYIVKSMVKVQ